MIVSQLLTKKRKKHELTDFMWLLLQFENHGLIDLVFYYSLQQNDEIEFSKR